MLSHVVQNSLDDAELCPAVARRAPRSLSAPPAAPAARLRKCPAAPGARSAQLALSPAPSRRSPLAARWRLPAACRDPCAPADQLESQPLHVWQPVHVALQFWKPAHVAVQFPRFACRLLAAPRAHTRAHAKPYWRIQQSVQHQLLFACADSAVSSAHFARQPARLYRHARVAQPLCKAPLAHCWIASVQSARRAPWSSGY
mmetsp:Transcript_73422/g.138761  ORF Transcript_73422/g.138761 Transcript_73422/m.138761 type:complete len:201 (+) Transcript_73422:61-663(+)